MALLINKFLRNSLLLQMRSVLSSRSIQVTSVQQLYSPASLGIDSYLQTRKKIKEQFASFSDKFILKMNDFINDEKSLIFTEDLKNMVHIAEPIHLEVVVKMIHKFNSQKTEFRFGSFVFGPVVMRMFHFLDAPKEALQVFQDPVNNGFFDQLVSYQILLDLLYSNEMYDEMYKVFETIQEKQINMTKFPKYPVVLILAACYKQNTPQTFEYATKLWSEMSEVGNKPLRRACTFFAGLALKQGAPHIALESISTQKQHYITLRNIKAKALAQLGRVDDVLPILRSVLDVDGHQKNKHTFFEDTVSCVREAVEKSNNKDAQKEFQIIEKSLRDHALIDSQTLDQLLNAEITLTPKNNKPPTILSSMPYHLRQKNRQNLS